MRIIQMYHTTFEVTMFIGNLEKQLGFDKCQREERRRSDDCLRASHGLFPLSSAHFVIFFVYFFTPKAFSTFH